MIKSQWKSILKSFNDNSSCPESEWEKNTKKNIERFHKSNSIWNLAGCLAPPNDKAVVIVGASPCLAKDVHKLKECDSQDFCIIVVNSALKYILDRGIKPDFVTALDSDDEDIYKHLDIDSKDLTLIASNVISPRVLDNWKGKIWFFPYLAVSKKLKRRVINRLGKTIPVGGNALNTMVSTSVQIFGTRIVILVGSECCYDKHYYPSKSIPRNNPKPTEFYIQDINGKERITSITLNTYKLWLERFALQLSPYIKIIDTSEGILGRRDEKSYIYTYELSEIIGKVKEAANKKREIIHANPTLFNAPLYPQRFGRQMQSRSSGTDVRDSVAIGG